MDIHNPIPCPSSAAPSQLHSPSFNLRQSAVFIADIYLNGRCSPSVSIQPSLCTRPRPEHILSLPTAQSRTCPQHTQGLWWVDHLHVSNHSKGRGQAWTSQLYQNKTTKSPPVLFESYVHCLALVWLGLVTHNLQFHVKINFNPSSSH